MGYYNPYWSFISGAIGASLMMWIAGYYAKGHRPRRDETTGGVVLEYPTSFKVMSLTLLIAGCGMVLIPLVVIGIKEPEDPYIYAALFLFFAGAEVGQH